MGKIQKWTDELQRDGLWTVLKHAANSITNPVCYYLCKAVCLPMSVKPVIVIESHNDFDCNGGAFYQYLIDHAYHKTYKIVWIIKNQKPAVLPDNVECYNYTKASLKKEYYLNVAKYILNDDKFFPKRKKEQMTIYCTHGGITFKNVKGIINVPDYVDYILTSSEQYAPLVCDNFSIPYPNHRMLNIGFPSNDLLFADGPLEYVKKTGKHYSKVILWMPTFRKNSATRNDSDQELPFGIPLFFDEAQFEEFNTLLAEYDTLLIIKIHPMQLKETYQKLKDTSNIVIIDKEIAKKKDIDNYRLMRSCDAMISDFSSSPYSYIVLNRPIAFDLSDLKTYKLGFSVENIDDYLPGEKIYSLAEFKSFILSVIRGEDPDREKRMKLIDWLYDYPDGKCCERLADFMKL